MDAIEDTLVKLIEPILEKYKRSLFKKGYGGEDKIDFRNFAAYDIVKCVLTSLKALNYQPPLDREKVAEPDSAYFDDLLQKMICEVPQLRRLWTWKDGKETLQDNIKLGIVFDLLEHLHKHAQLLQLEKEG